MDTLIHGGWADYAFHSREDIIGILHQYQDLIGPPAFPLLIRVTRTKRDFLAKRQKFSIQHIVTHAFQYGSIISSTNAKQLYIYIYILTPSEPNALQNVGVPIARVNRCSLQRGCINLLRGDLFNHFPGKEHRITIKNMTHIPPNCPPPNPKEADFRGVKPPERVG